MLRTLGCQCLPAHAAGLTECFRVARRPCPRGRGGAGRRECPEIPGGSQGAPGSWKTVGAGGSGDAGRPGAERG